MVFCSLFLSVLKDPRYFRGSFFQHGFYTVSVQQRSWFSYLMIPRCFMVSFFQLVKAISIG